MKRFLIVLIAISLVVPVFSASVNSAISYYSSADTYNCKPPAQAFRNNISANNNAGPYVGYVNRFTTSNDSYWDARDMGFVCAHGNRWLFALSNGTVYLDNLTDGWGDNNLEWTILYSCLVVASPLERPNDWWQPWIIESTDVFDRLHIVNGFRTSALVSPAVNVTTNYCSRVNNGNYVLDSWFDAIYAYGQYWGPYDQGTSMYYGTCEYDTFNSFASDPSETQTSDFHCYYMD